MTVHWIQTYTGKRFFPLDPRAEDLDIRDIAHSLSLLCRFNGHCSTFYSVAEHSVRVSKTLPQEQALWGLLHDAGEAYLTDLPRPVKTQLVFYRDLEESLLQVVARRYQLEWPMPPAIETADLTLLATEARDLMAPPPCSWELDATPLHESIEPWSSEIAEQRFLDRFAELKSR